MKVESQFYRIYVGQAPRKVYAVDLRFAKKVRKTKTPPLPKFTSKDHDGIEEMRRFPSAAETSGEIRI